MRIGNFGYYGLGNTPLHHATKHCPNCNVYIKLEAANPHGSVKDRTAYYIVKDLIDTGRLQSSSKLVESSSGNLALALAFFAGEVGVPFVCLADPSIVPEKLEELQKAGVEVRVVSLGSNSDLRTARIQTAKELAKRPDWIWTNQYDNLANFKAHFETTGPEIWAQTAGRIEYVVCSVGTGGTICGVGCYLKQRNPAMKVIAVEPKGSTIFGGEPGDYLNAGAGMAYPSGIMREHGHVVDYFCQVDDGVAIQECNRIGETEALSLGITGGAATVVARHLATKHPDSCIVALAPDSGERYVRLLQSGSPGAQSWEYVPLLESTVAYREIVGPGEEL